MEENVQKILLGEERAIVKKTKKKKKKEKKLRSIEL